MFVMVPFGGAGRAPERLPHRHYPAKTQPAGFVEVTADTIAHEALPALRARQFLCKQPGGFPKYVVISEPLILKLERIIDALDFAGHDVDTLAIMSGYRTPFYNEGIGNVRDSQHTAGTAADIFVDEKVDGRMDDLDRDGMVTGDDADLAVPSWSTAWIACPRRCSPAGSGTTAPPPRTARSSTSTCAAVWRGGAADRAAPAAAWSRAADPGARAPIVGAVLRWRFQRLRRRAGVRRGLHPR